MRELVECGVPTLNGASDCVQAGHVLVGGRELLKSPLGGNVVVRGRRGLRVQLQRETVGHGVVKGCHHVLAELVGRVGVLSGTRQRGQEGVDGGDGGGHPSLQLLVRWQVGGGGLGSGEGLGVGFVRDVCGRGARGTRQLRSGKRSRGGCCRGVSCREYGSGLYCCDRSGAWLDWLCGRVSVCGLSLGRGGNSRGGTGGDGGLRGGGHGHCGLGDLWWRGRGCRHT